MVMLPYIAYMDPMGYGWIIEYMETMCSILADTEVHLPNGQNVPRAKPLQETPF